MSGRQPRVGRGAVSPPDGDHERLQLHRCQSGPQRTPHPDPALTRAVSPSRSHTLNSAGGGCGEDKGDQLARPRDTAPKELAGRALLGRLEGRDSRHGLVLALRDLRPGVLSDPCVVGKVGPSFPASPAGRGSGRRGSGWGPGPGRREGPAPTGAQEACPLPGALGRRAQGRQAEGQAPRTPQTPVSKVTADGSAPWHQPGLPPPRLEPETRRGLAGPDQLPRHQGHGRSAKSCGLGERHSNKGVRVTAGSLQQCSVTVAVITTGWHRVPARGVELSPEGVSTHNP